MIEVGMDIPDLDPPDVSPAALFYHQAFLDLWQYREPKHSRDYLPWETLSHYAGRYNLTNREFEEFVEMIRSMENVLLEHRFREQQGEPNGKEEA